MRKVQDPVKIQSKTAWLEAFSEEEWQTPQVPAVLWPEVPRHAEQPGQGEC